MKSSWFLVISVCSLAACDGGKKDFDASGIFEAKEIIISAEAAGKLTTFAVEEGAELKAGQQVAAIDCSQVSLQKEQAQASLNALRKKTFDPAEQINVLKKQELAQKSQIASMQEQMNNLTREEKRLTNLVLGNAAPRKQLDDIEGQIEVLRKQIEAANVQSQVLQQQITAQLSANRQQNEGILGEAEPLQKRLAQVDDQLGKCAVTNPANGTVLTKYAELHEVTAPGKPLYKLADLSTMTLRAYVSGSQLSGIKINQPVKVLLDGDGEKPSELQGTVTWISDKAEFTPKTIQTKEERVNLVYAVKVAVPNDGSIKIGMYGEVVFGGENKEKDKR